MTKELYVDVDINQGVNYGVSVGGTEVWPGAEGAQRIRVQYDLNSNRFINLFVDRIFDEWKNWDTLIVFTTARDGVELYYI